MRQRITTEVKEIETTTNQTNIRDHNRISVLLKYTETKKKHTLNTYTSILASH